MVFQYWYAIPKPIRNIIPGLIVYFLVSGWAVSTLGVNPNFATTVGAAAGFGTVAVVWKSPL